MMFKLYVRSKNTTQDVAVKNQLLMRPDDSTIHITGDSDTITLSCTADSFSTWYDKFLDRKLLTMCTGGSPISGTEFSKGLNGSKYATAVRTVCGASPDSNGNVQLLPGKTLDVYKEDGRIVMEQIKIPVADYSSVLNDLNKCVWYLYHTYNSFLYRMHKWAINEYTSPMFKGTRLLGTIPSYQAVVAAWNLRVWRKSFLWDIRAIRDSISFSIGYMAIDCVVQSVTCTITLTVTNAPDASICYYTIYQQGVSSNIEDRAITPVITKYKKNGDTTNINGMGSDEFAEQGKLSGVWTEIKITVPISNMKQGEYYKAMFSVAVAQNSVTAATYNGINSGSTHKLSVQTTWDVEDSGGSRNYGMITDAELPTLDTNILEDD